MEWFKWIFGNRFWPFPPTSSVSFMHLHEWDWWAFWWSGESLCPVFPQNTCRCLKFCLLYFQFYFVTFSSSNSCLKLRYSFSKHLTICLYLLCSILSCFCTALCYAHCLNVWKNTAHIPDDNILLCFCVNDSQTLSNAQKWNHNVCGRHYYRLCHFLLLVKGLYKVNQGHWSKNRPLQIFFLALLISLPFPNSGENISYLQKMRYIIQQILNPSVYLFLLIHFQNPSIVCGDYHLCLVFLKTFQ